MVPPESIQVLGQPPFREFRGVLKEVHCSWLYLKSCSPVFPGMLQSPHAASICRAATENTYHVHPFPQNCLPLLLSTPLCTADHTELVSSGDLTYVGGNWTRDVAFAGYSIPLAGDFPARRMIDSIPGVDPARKERLIKVR
eukprot:scaffold41308_cov17-Tisochrysis_lutea.AAC.1